MPVYEKNPGKEQLGSGTWQTDGGTVQPETIAVRRGIPKPETAAFLSVALLETGKLLRGKSKGVDLQKEYRKNRTGDSTLETVAAFFAEFFLKTPKNLDKTGEAVYK